MIDLNGNGPKNIAGTGDGSPGSPLVQQTQEAVLEAGIGALGELPWGGVGNASVIALLKAIALAASHFGTVADGSGTLSLGGSAQTLFGGATPANGYLVQNHSAGSLWVHDLGTAAASQPSIEIPGNGSMFVTPQNYKPPGPVSLYGDTTGQAFTARRW